MDREKINKKGGRGGGGGGEKWRGRRRGCMGCEREGRRM